MDEEKVRTKKTNLWKKADQQQGESSLPIRISRTFSSENDVWFSNDMQQFYEKHGFVGVSYPRHPHKFARFVPKNVAQMDDDNMIAGRTFA